MAGVLIPRAALRPLLSAPCEIRGFAHLPGFPRLGGFPVHGGLGCSRALGDRAYRRDVRGNNNGLMGVRRWGKEAFSTSVVRRDGKGEGKLGSKAVGETGQSKPTPTPSPKPTKPLTAIASTLKAKVTTTLRHENIYTIPNILTLSRLIATPAIGYLILTNQHLYAFILFSYAGFSDLLDGWIARRWNLQTVVGSVVDPMADKALMTTLVTCLAVNGTLSLPLATLILGRDVSLALAALYYRYASLPAPKTWGRYWDFSLPSAEVHPTTVSKFNTFLQLVLIGTTMCVSLLHDPAALESAAGGYLQRVQEGLGGPEGVKLMVQGMSGVVAATTVWSGLSYAWMKDAVKILGENEELKRRQGARGRMIVGGCFGTFICVAVWFAWREVEKRRLIEDDSEEKEG